MILSDQWLCKWSCNWEGTAGVDVCQDSSSCCQSWHFRVCCPSLLNCLPGYNRAWSTAHQSLSVISLYDSLALDRNVLRTHLEHCGVCFRGIMGFERTVWVFGVCHLIKCHCLENDGPAVSCLPAGFCGMKWTWMSITSHPYWVDIH